MALAEGTQFGNNSRAWKCAEWKKVFWTRFSPLDSHKHHSVFIYLFVFIFSVSFLGFYNDVFLIVFVGTNTKIQYTTPPPPHRPHLVPPINTRFCVCTHAFICFDTIRSRISEARNVGNDVINNNNNNFYKVLYPVKFTSSRRCNNNTQPLILSLSC